MDRPRQNPYVGPRSFEEQDRGVFFGRQEESRQLTSLIIAHRVVLFYAPSGTGKTSLLNASVIPDLKSDKKVIALPMSRVGGDLPEMDGNQVGNIFVFNALLHLELEYDLAHLASMDLVEGLRPLLQSREDEERRLRPRLLILDQFEELFTQHPERHADQAGFFEQISRCLEAYPQLSLLLSMREDYIAHLDPYASLMPDRLRTRFRMERLDTRGALEAVKKPAALAGRPFEDGVAEALVDNLRRIQVSAPGARPESGPPPLGNYVEPVHLQIVCQQLWAGLPPGEGRIRLEDLQEFGDVDTALAGFYERTLEMVRQQTGVSERHLRNWFEAKLITPARTRGLVYGDNEETTGLPQEAVSRLYEAYLIRTEVRSGAVWYELSHDRLIEPILASNAAWQRAHLQPFQRQAEVWNSSGQPASLLLREEALKEAEAWAEGRTGELLPQEKDFLESSRQTNELEILEREARSAAQLRRIGKLALVEAFLFILGIGIPVAYLIADTLVKRGQLSEGFTSSLSLPCLLSPVFLLMGMVFSAVIFGLTFRLSLGERRPQPRDTENALPAKPARASPSETTALLSEVFFGVFGILGMGWLYAKNLAAGFLAFIGYFVVVDLPALLILPLYGYPRSRAIFPNLVVAVISGLLVKNYVRKNRITGSRLYLVLGIVAGIIIFGSCLILSFFSPGLINQNTQP